MPLTKSGICSINQKVTAGHAPSVSASLSLGLNSFLKGFLKAVFCLKRIHHGIQLAKGILRLSLLHAAEVANFIGYSRQNAKRIADTLHERGYVTIMKDKNDARALRIALTKKCKEYSQNEAIEN